MTISRRISPKSLSPHDAFRGAAIAGSLMLLVVATSLPAVEIGEVRVAREIFDPGKGETGEVMFRLDSDAQVTMQVYDGRELLVRELPSEAARAGEMTLRWDGKDNAGRQVPAEAYHFVLTAVGADGSNAVVDLTDATGGEQMAADNVRWSADAGRIHYRLPKAARVNIRVGLQNNGPLLKTVVDWVARPAGDHADGWDGWDNDHVFDASRHPKLAVFVDAYALSANTLIVAPLESRVNLIDRMPWGRQQRASTVSPKKLMHYHSQQALESRGDVGVRIDLLENTPRDTEGLPLLDGVVQVRLQVDEKDVQRVLERRFEPVFFLDGVFAFENEVGYLPFNWLFDARAVNEGVHYITANVRGYEGNFGMSTIKVRVRHAQSGGSSP